MTTGSGCKMYTHSCFVAVVGERVAALRVQALAVPVELGLAVPVELGLAVPVELVPAGPDGKGPAACDAKDCYF